MKNLVMASICFLSVTALAQIREVVSPGDEGLRRGTLPSQIVKVHPDRGQSLIPVNSTPFAFNFCSLSLPSAPELDVIGFRLNITVPFATPDHRDVVGFDIGLSAECTGHIGGVAVNVFDNWSNSFSGCCIGLVNVTGEMRGVQIGLVNVADCGAGLQIGLWNQSRNFRCPLIGIVW